MHRDHIDQLRDALDGYSEAAIDAHSHCLERCLEEGLDSSAVVVLNAGFESIVSSALEETLRESDDILAQRRQEEIQNNNAWYSGMLEEAHGLDIIDQDIYEQLDELRQERNEYVHADDIDDIAISREDIEEDHADLEDAYNLYYDIIDGHDRSVDERFFRKQGRKPGSGKWDGGTHRVPA